MQPMFSKNNIAYWEIFRKEWLNVFIICAEVYVFGAIIFTVLGSGNEQSWAKTDKEEKDVSLNSN